MFRLVSRTAMVLVLSVAFFTATARAADEIEILTTSGESKTPPQVYEKDQLHTALDEVLTGETIVLEPGIEYPIDDSNSVVQNKHNITIEGGYTVRISNYGPSGGYLTSNNHGRSNGDKVQLFGHVPSPLVEGQTYYVVDAVPNVFRLANSPGGAHIGGLDAPGNLKLDNGTIPLILLAKYHAKIVPLSSSTDYDALLHLQNCDDFTIQHVTFDGKYDRDASGYENGFKEGSTSIGGLGLLFKAFSCGGLNKLTGVHVANNRGRDETNDGVQLDTAGAYAIQLSDCDQVNLYNCSGSNTGYFTWHMNENDYVRFDYCRAENPHHRVIGHNDVDTRDADTGILINYCNFINETDRETHAKIYSDRAHSLLGNIDHRTTGASDANLMPNFSILNSYVDWKIVEPESNPTGSWNYTGNDTTNILKIEGIENAHFINCDFRHGGNNGNTKISATLKTDATKVVKNLTIDQCKFSGPINLEPTLAGDLGTFELLDSEIQVDGRFNAAESIIGIRYPTLTITDSTAHNVGFNGVIRMGTDDFVATGWTWTITGLTADPEAGAAREFCVHYPTNSSYDGASPKLSEVNSNFDASNTFNTLSGTVDWFFSTSDPNTDISD